MRATGNVTSVQGSRTSESSPSAPQTGNSEISTNIHVGNIHSSVTEHELCLQFGGFGPIASVSECNLAINTSLIFLGKDNVSTWRARIHEGSQQRLCCLYAKDRCPACLTSDERQTNSRSGNSYRVGTSCPFAHSSSVCTRRSHEETQSSTWCWPRKRSAAIIAASRNSITTGANIDA